MCWPLLLATCKRVKSTQWVVVKEPRLLVHSNPVNGVRLACPDVLFWAMQEKSVVWTIDKALLVLAIEMVDEAE